MKKNLIKDSRKNRKKNKMTDKKKISEALSLTEQVRDKCFLNAIDKKGLTILSDLYDVVHLLRKLEDRVE